MDSLPTDLSLLSPVVFLVYGEDDQPDDCILTTPEEVTAHSHTYTDLEEWKARRVYEARVFTAYKRVDQKIKPVPAVFPEDARVSRRFPEDPLASLKPLPRKPPDFYPTAKLTQERLDSLQINHKGYLWPEEEKLFAHIVKLNERVLAFEDAERGTLREDYFTPDIMPIVPHIPWAHGNIPIPPGIKDKVVELLKEKMRAGVYERSQSSYRSRWFCVLKKNGNLRIVHDLQPLNAVSIRETGLPPVLDDFVEPFAGRKCYTVFDLYWGFDARKVNTLSRPMTAFLTPLGLLQITSMPTGYTNSPSEFQACMTFILQDEIPHTANIFIDDLPIKGPSTIYPDADGDPEVLPENPGIRRYIWEHAQDVHRIMHRIGHAGAKFSPKKAQVCRPEVVIVGQKCTEDGRLPDEERVSKILNWPPLTTPKEVRGFLGLCGTVRIWIKDYSALARPLTELTRKGAEFEWTDRRQEAFDTLKMLVSTAPALRPIDYSSDLPIILSVDSSKYAVGFILSQIDEEGRRRPARYGSLPMNERESNYSQPKLELYGLYRALRHFRLYLIGAKNLHVEVDAKYIRGMMNEPDLQPNATLNRWIQGILMYDFKLIHVPADKHKGPDALSRRRLGYGEQIEEHDDSWLDEIALYATLDGPHFRDELDQYASLQTPRKSPSVYLIEDQSQDGRLRQVKHYLETLEVPEFKTSSERLRFLKKCAQYFVTEGDLFRRYSHKMPLKVVLDTDQRAAILKQAHDDHGHRGEQSTFETIRQRFFWPHYFTDVRHYVRSCHTCQIRSIRKIETPLTISTPVTIFTKFYLDIMHMPKAKGYRYIVAARDDLSGACEARALKAATSRAVSQFLWEQIICRYGAIGEIVTDNGSETKGAFQILVKRYKIPHIRISPYNSKANGVVERGHFILREALVKACQGNIMRWPEMLPHAVFADRITIRKATGFSAFYLLHGVHPVLPFDLTEATFMVKGFYSGMAPEDLLALRIQQLQKKPADLLQASDAIRQSRLTAKSQFERRFLHRLKQDAFNPGDLVLVRNTAVEKELNRKTKARYFGPYEVVRRTQGGSYVVKELSGELSRSGIAAFRLLKYHPATDDLASLPAEPIQSIGGREDIGSQEEEEIEEEDIDEAGSERDDDESEDKDSGEEEVEEGDDDDLEDEARDSLGSLTHGTPHPTLP